VKKQEEDRGETMLLCPRLPFDPLEGPNEPDLAILKPIWIKIIQFGHLAFFNVVENTVELGYNEHFWTGLYGHDSL
jgi:hypothetical protein